MNGAKLRERLSRGECVSMLTSHYASPGHAVRLRWGCGSPRYPAR